MFSKTNEIKRLKKNQEQNIKDDYSLGIYNGLELALSVLEKREPDFKTIENETKIVEGNEMRNSGRTIANGIIKRI